MLKHHNCRVDDERPYIRGGLRLPGYLVSSDPPPGAVDKHFKVKRPAHRRLVGAGKVDVDRLIDLPACLLYTSDAADE